MGRITNNLAEQKQASAQPSINKLMNTMLDSEGMRKRFEDLMGERTPQFVSALISLVNATPALQEAFRDSPMTVIQSALKAATFDLTIDPNLGYAYLVPFKNKQSDGSRRMECSFIMGYKGMLHLAIRSGVYERIEVMDVRESELISRNRLKGDVVIEEIEDDAEREKAPIIGYAGYYRLINGMEKMIYMSMDQLIAHEKKHRKGQYIGKGWKDDFHAMCSKTIMRQLIGKWGVMSTEYRNKSSSQAFADAMATGRFDDEDMLLGVDAEAIEAEYEISEEPAEVEPEQTTLDNDVQ